MTHYNRHGIPFLSNAYLDQMKRGETPASVHPLKNQPFPPAKGKKVRIK
jgi:hypothetical protein